MNLSKKQVSYLLKVVSSDYTRPVLCGVYIDEYKGDTVVVATDGYVLVMLKAPDLKEHVGQFIAREEIVKWYKLASYKDNFDGSIQAMYSELFSNYPQWQKIVNKIEKAAVDSITFNEDYVYNMCKLAGTPLTWTMNGKNGAITSTDKHDNMYVVMPLKG